MPQLDRETYLEILDLLYPLTETADERANLFTLAFAGYEMPRIDVRSGTQDIAVQRMIRKLADYGTIGNKTTLWMLLEYILDSGLIGEDKQERIKALESKVNVPTLLPRDPADTLASGEIRDTDNPVGIPAQAVEDLDSLTGKGRLLPLFEIAYYGLLLSDVMPDFHHFDGEQPYYTKALELYTHMNTVRLCAKQVFGEKDYIRITKIFDDVEKLISEVGAETDPDKDNDILAYSLDAAEELLRGLQSTLDGKLLAAFTIGAILAEWTTYPESEDYEITNPRSPLRHFNDTVKILTTDADKIEELDKLAQVALKSGSYQWHRIRPIYSLLRQIIVHHDLTSI